MARGGVPIAIWCMEFSNIVVFKSEQLRGFLILVENYLSSQSPPWPLDYIMIRAR
jgi:hypothetical protein